MREVLVNGRWPVLLPEHRAARESWPWHEAARFAAMHHVLANLDAPVLWDVGAELGDHAAVYASWGCRLVLIEPNPQAWPCIKATLDANGARGAVEAWCWAFAGAEADALHIDALSTTWAKVPPIGFDWPPCADSPCTERAGMAHLDGRPDPDPLPTQPATTIDALVAAGFAPPHALTIDVEGAEMLVLQGAQATLEAHRPLLWLSVHPDLLGRYGASEAGVHAFLTAAGYEGVLLATDHEQHWQWTPRG